MANEPTYYGTVDGRVFKRPINKGRDDKSGLTTFEVGFPVCKVSEYCDSEEGAKAIAALMNMGEEAQKQHNVELLVPWNEELEEVMSHLGAAIMQSTSRDDQIIMDHVKAAHEIIRIVCRKTRS